MIPGYIPKNSELPFEAGSLQLKYIYLLTTWINLDENGRCEKREEIRV